MTNRRSDVYVATGHPPPAQGPCGIPNADGSVCHNPGRHPVRGVWSCTTHYKALTRRERTTLIDPPPTRGDLEREFRVRWTPTGFGDRTTEEGYQRRVATLLDNFWQGEVSSLSEALHEELDFELTLEPEDGSPPVVINGQIDS